MLTPEQRARLAEVAGGGCRIKEKVYRESQIGLQRNYYNDPQPTTGE